MYCSKCGKIIPDDSNFCKHCGASQTGQASSFKQSNIEVVYLEITRSSYDLMNGLVFRTQEPLFSQIKQRLDCYMHDAIKEKYYDDYLRKCDIRSYSTGTELKCKNGFTIGFEKQIYEGLMSIFDQLGFDMKVESSVPMIRDGNSRGMKITYRGKR